MTTTVTVSEFRENLSKYIDLVNEKGKEVKIVDGRKGKVVGKFVKEKRKKEFDWEKHLEEVKKIKPFFTERDVEKIKELRRRSRERRKRLNW